MIKKWIEFGLFGTFLFGSVSVGALDITCPATVPPGETIYVSLENYDDETPANVGVAMATNTYGRFANIAISGPSVRSLGDGWDNCSSVPCSGGPYEVGQVSSRAEIGSMVFVTAGLLDDENEEIDSEGCTIRVEEAPVANAR